MCEMTSRPVLVLTILLTAAASRADELTFNMTLCGGTYPACATNGYQREATSDELQGLNAGAFYDYFSVFLPGLLPLEGQFDWNVTGSTSSGILVGRVDDTQDGIHTGFVYRDGSIVCCTEDDPFALLDINENGLMVGVADFSDPGLFEVPSASPMGGGGTPAHVPYRIVNQQIDLFNAQFLGIDNENRIFGQAPDQFGATDLRPRSGSDGRAGARCHAAAVCRRGRTAALVSQKARGVVCPGGLYAP